MKRRLSIFFALLGVAILCGGQTLRPVSVVNNLRGTNGLLSLRPITNQTALVLGETDAFDVSPRIATHGASWGATNNSDIFDAIGGGQWRLVTAGGSSPAGTNSGTVVTVGGSYGAAVNFATSAEIASALVGTNANFTIVNGSIGTNRLSSSTLAYLMSRTNHTDNIGWSFVTGTPTTLSGYGIIDAQPLDSDLTALAGLGTTGLEVRTGSGTAATRTITGTSGRLTVSNGDGVGGNPVLDVDTNTLAQAINGGAPNGSGAFFNWSRLLAVPSDLTSIAALSTTGILARTGSGTEATRTITGTSGRVTIANGSGQSGDPVVDIDTNGLAQSINSGSPNGAGAFVHWSKLVGVPAGFADGTDDGGGGGSAIGVNGGVGGSVTNFPDTTSITWTASGGSASAKTAHRRLASWRAEQGYVGTTASSQPVFAPRGDNVGAYLFDPSTANLLHFQTDLPSGYNLAGGLEFIIVVAPNEANPGSSNTVWQAAYMKLCCGTATVDSDSYSGTTLITNKVTGVAGVATNLTFTLSSWNGFSSGDTIQIELTKVAGSASDDSTNKIALLSARLNVISQ